MNRSKPKKAKATKTPAAEINLLDRIREQVVAHPEHLNVGDWRTCKTTHCLAGWAQFLAGDMKAVPQEEGTRLIPSAQHLFFAHKTLVLAWLKSRKYADKSSAAFMEALQAAGVTVVTDGEHKVSSGILYATGNATISAVSGGEAWADGNATISAVSGGVALRWNDRTSSYEPHEMKAKGSKARAPIFAELERVTITCAHEAAQARVKIAAREVEKVNALIAVKSANLAKARGGGVDDPRLDVVVDRLMPVATGQLRGGL